MTRILRTTTCIIGLAAGTAPLLSCAPAPTAPAYPGVMTILNAQRDALVTPADDALRARPAGSVLDSLEGVAGCWAAYLPAEQFEAQDPANAELAREAGLVILEYYAIDVAGGTMQFAALVATERPAWYTYIELSGPLQLLAPNRLRMGLATARFGGTEVPIRDYSGDELADLLRSNAAEQPGQQADDPLTWEFLATRSGDKLKLVRTWTEGGQPVRDEERPSVATRITCP